MSKVTYARYGLFGWGSPSKRRRRRANREKSLVWWFGPAAAIALLTSLIGMSVAVELRSAIPEPTPGWFMLAYPVLVPVVLWASYARQPERVRRGWRAYVPWSRRTRTEKPLAWWFWRALFLLHLMVFALVAWAAASAWLQVFVILLGVESMIVGLLDTWAAFREPPARLMSRAATA